MKIEENVYALESTKGSYSYLIKDKETILIDTGNPGKVKNILKEIESLNIKPKNIKHILLTHHDVDHIGNATLLQKETGATLWASKKDIPYILGDKGRPGIKKLSALLMRVKKPEKIKSYNDQKIDNYIKNMKFTNEVKVSGNIVKSNATVDIDKNTKEWTYKLSEIDDDTAMLLSYKLKK